MDPNQILVAVTGLVASIIGAGAVLFAQRSQWKRDRIAAADDQASQAVEEILVRALSVDLRAHEFTVIATNLSSLSGLLSRLLRTFTPIDMSGLFELLNADAVAMNRASAQIWMASDQATVTLTNAVVAAAMDVVDAHHTPRRGNRIIRYLRELIFGKQLGDLQNVERTRRRLAETRRELVEHARRSRKLSDVQLMYSTDAETTYR